MRDLFFFPLAALFVAGMIYFALSMGGETETRSDADVLRDGYVLSGLDFSALTAAAGTNFIVPDETQINVNYVVMSAQVPREGGPASLGVFATLGPQYEKVFADRTIEITVRARQGQVNPSESFEMGYYTLDAGASGWKEFEITENFEDYAFRFKPGLPQDEAEIDYLGIWPSPSGESKSIDVERITVKVVQP